LSTRFELAFERLQPHKGQDTLDQSLGIAGHAHQIGQPLVIHRTIVEHADRKVAKARVLGQHGEERLDDPGTQAFADDDAVDVAGVEIAGRGLDAQCADEADALADRDRKHGIGPAASHAEHGRVIEHVGRNGLWKSGLRARGVGAAQHSGMQRPDAQRRAQPCNQPVRGVVELDRKRIRDRRRAVLVQERNDRHDGATTRVDGMGDRAQVLGRRRAFRVGDGERDRLDLGDGGGSIRPACLHDRERPGLAEHVDQVGRRVLGDHDHRTQECHDNEPVESELKQATLGDGC